MPLTRPFVCMLNRPYGDNPGWVKPFNCRPNLLGVKGAIIFYGLSWWMGVGLKHFVGV